MNRHYRLLGRKKAGTWGKPHKDKRTTANRAVRTVTNRETIAARRDHFVALAEAAQMLGPRA